MEACCVCLLARGRAHEGRESHGTGAGSLDNNHVERQLRDRVLGRKNHYGSKSQRGTEVAALFYSLIETARLSGEDPGHYLQRAALTTIEDPGTVTRPQSQG
jgi:hypothetical protein